MLSLAGVRGRMRDRPETTPVFLFLLSFWGRSPAGRAELFGGARSALGLSLSLLWSGPLVSSHLLSGWFVSRRLLPGRAPSASHRHLTPIVSFAAGGYGAAGDALDGLRSLASSPSAPARGVKVTLSIARAARSLRSLACSAQAPFRYPCSARGRARLRSRLIRGRNKGAALRPRSALNRLSPAFRPAPLIVAYGVRWRCRYGGALAPSLSLVSLPLPPSLLAPLPVGFCPRPSRLGGSTGLACQVPRLVSAIPPCVSQSAAGIFRPSRRAFAAAHRPSLFGLCLCAVPCAELLCGGACGGGASARGAHLRYAPLRSPFRRPPACAMRPLPRLAPDGACALLRRAQGLHWRYLRFSKYQMSLS